MASIGFDDNGYEYFDKSRHVLFTSDSTHNLLFDYVAQDPYLLSSRLPELLEQYISKKMNLVTLELNDYQYNDGDSAEMKETLILLHPYYKHEYKKVIIKAIGDYFNILAFHLSCNYDDENKFQSIKHRYTEKWHNKRFFELIGPFLPCEFEDNSFPEFYSRYKGWVGKKEDLFYYNLPPATPPIGFIKEKFTQGAIKNMLSWILDISDPNLEELTIYQRVWLYDHIYSDGMAVIPAMKVTKQLFLQPARRFHVNRDDSKEVEHDWEMQDLFESLYDLRRIDINYDNISTAKLNAIKAAIEHAKAISEYEIYEEYQVDSLYQLLYLEILSMIQNNTMISKCRHCSKYFIVANRKIAYCDRMDEEGKRCSEVGSIQSFQKKMEMEYPLKIYNRAYKTHHARYKHGNITKNAFSTWRDEAKKNLEKVRKGEMATTDFEEWLKT